MSKKGKKNTRTCQGGSKSIGYLLSDAAYKNLCVSGYTSLDKNPEIMTACRKIAELIGTITIHLMENTKQGDKRVVNELSKKIDIEPSEHMTRATWIESIVMNLLLYGNGNSIIMPHTRDGLIQDLEPISASRVSIVPNGYRDYKVLIDGIPRSPNDVLHFVHNPDPIYMWMGRGLSVSLKDVAANLKQAAATEKGFMSTEYRPSIIVKVDGFNEGFSGPEGRQRLAEQYLRTTNSGEPWIIPADQFQVEQVRPLTLADLAINDTVEMDKRAVAAILGVPPFVVGVGSYNAEEWNSFVQSTIMTLCKAISAEMTRKLILNPKWYLRFNVWSLLDYDIQTVSSVLLAGSDRGFVNGDEWRDRLNMPPAGLTEFRILENYLPWDMSGLQKKLVQSKKSGGEENE